MIKILRTLGKLIIILVSTNTLAQVNSSVNSGVNKTNIKPNENVSFTISAIGNSINFPQINNINNYPIISSYSSSSIVITNGDKNKIINKTYTFKPTSKTTIPAYVITIDGKNYQTKPITINVSKPQQNKIGDDFILSITTDKNEAYVGEDIKLTVIFKRKNNVSANRIKIGPPQAKGLFIQQNGTIIKSKSNDYSINKLHYDVVAEKSGKITINPTSADIGIVNNSLNSFFNDINWSKIYSNSLTIIVKPLTDNLTIFGNYKISAITDKTTVNSGNPINLTVRITGDGNIADIEKFEISINNATIYADKPEINNNTWTQKIAIIANKNFIIPSFSLDYFDQNSKAKKTISTNKIKIQVVHKKAIEENGKVNKITSNKNLIIENNNYKYLYFLGGMLCGIFIFYIITYLQKIKIKIKNNEDIIKLIKKSKTDKQLFDLLLPYNNEKISIILQKLEANIYKKENNKINKKHIIQIFNDNYII